MAPKDVNKGNARELFDYLQQKISKRKKKTKIRFQLGDLVRVALNLAKKKDFRKGYEPKWSRAIYQIDQIYKGRITPMYKIIGPSGKLLSRRFYDNELNLVVSFKDLSLE